MKTKNVIDVKPHSLHEEIDNNKHDDELPNHGDSLNESIKDETTPAKSSGESRKRFDRSDGEKGWTMWQWNPVTGCTNGCDYCYAEDIACNRHKSNFPYGFEPYFYEERLAAPKNTRVPKKAETDIRHESVFVCMMGDLFCDGVKEEWICEVLEAVEEHYQWNFLFFTKNPQRMAEFEFPDNAWVGASVDKRFRIKDTEEAFQKINAKVKMLSCEPLLEDLTEGSTRDLTPFLKLFDWVIIGAQNRTASVPEKQPQWEWVENLLMQARKAGCLVYFRPGLTVRPQEYPVPNYFLLSNSLKNRVSNLKESMSEDEFILFTDKLKQIQSHYNDNGKNECIRNYHLLQAIEQQEREVNGSESDTGDKDEKDSTQEPVQITEN